jgi:hypothetical protein
VGLIHEKNEGQKSCETGPLMDYNFNYRSVVDIVSDHFYPMSIWKLEEMSTFTTEILRNGNCGSQKLAEIIIFLVDLLFFEKLIIATGMCAFSKTTSYKYITKFNYII